MIHEKVRFLVQKASHVAILICYFLDPHYISTPSHLESPLSHTQTSQSNENQ